MGRRKGKGRSAKNAKVNQTEESKENEYVKQPHSFVFQRGYVGKTVKELVMDFRKIMEPYTAANLKVRKRNVMKDFLTIAGPLHVSHFVVFTKTETATYMHLFCVPKGPTLTFKVNEYTLSRDVLSFQKHPDVEKTLFSNHAVVVTNIPSDSLQNKLMNVTFKNMFPSINPNTIELNKMRRCVLVNYNQDTGTLDIRHYTMRVVPTGVSKGVKRLMKSKVPNLGHKNDISEVFLDKAMSDSEAEQDGPHNEVMVPQKVKDRGVKQNTQNAIRLKEVGPRLNLQLIKIEEGFQSGNVLYHSLVTKTTEEVEALKQMRHKKQKSKMARRQQQEANVKKKKQKKEDQIQKSLQGMNKKNESAPSEKKLQNDSDNADDDEEYYRQEVGENPEADVFSQNSRKRKRPDDASFSHPKRKKQKKKVTFKGNSKRK